MIQNAIADIDMKVKGIVPLNRCISTNSMYVPHPMPSLPPDLPNQTVGWTDSLRPLSPASVVQPLLLDWEPGLD